ncbi:hydrogenase formation protein HypD [Streptomyces sp. NBC_00513]|uniref:hydrogenase formation protein HypD n=1 Tax=unclassified Streptomyces TaxID=2593676 RepID=UPI00225B367D|nr:hydrogenase formation protein HypD [Streptomyces sp. NBC_00424]MCX5071664.1 hydrogenase formation protein HypD [Streptomyces sp. NBC_00424]WUD44949.1 hydrogenase formation protein HypD [Streptomyces sp. NBC_00513]
MKYIEEFQDPELARRLLDDIHATVTRPWALMEVCGGQTHTIIRHGIDQLLPDQVELIHGPGCPVCVTPLEVIDKALEIASRPDVIFCSFGDMLRVPGTGRDLFQVRSEGGDVRVVYSPLDALKIARQNPGKEVVFFGIGFETTAPPNAMTVHQARKLGIRNFSLLVSHVRVPPAIEAIMQSPSCRVQGFLAAGHVCSVMGMGEYPGLAARHRVPIVVTGFEPLDILEGVRHAVRQLERGEHTVDNAYARAVRPEGNPAAIAMLEDVFEVTDRAWRGIGVIPDSGWRLSERYREHDAEHRFSVTDITTREPAECRSGEVLQGLIKPNQCEAFGTTCTPRNPLGATMVSSEGACAAYYLYRRLDLTPVRATDPIARTAPLEASPVV